MVKLRPHQIERIRQFEKSDLPDGLKKYRIESYQKDCLKDNAWELEHAKKKLELIKSLELEKSKEELDKIIPDLLLTTQTQLQELKQRERDLNNILSLIKFEFYYAENDINIVKKVIEDRIRELE